MRTRNLDRRQFLRNSSAALAAATFPIGYSHADDEGPRFRLSLGQWTFHRAFRGAPGVAKRDPLEFPTMAGELGFAGVDYSGILLGDDHANPKKIAELNRRAKDAGVHNLLILVDLHDALGAKDAVKRTANVQKYIPWLESAAALGCTGVRVNPISDAGSSADEQARLLADGTSQLLEHADRLKLDIMFENHGEGLRTDGAWIASAVKRVDHPRCGTLPDFGNFQKNRAKGEFHDRYAGVAAMLPFAKGICAKSHDFDADGEECYSDYGRLLKMVVDSGYRGWIEVEYEGPSLGSGGPTRERVPADPLGEKEGALATKKLLQKHLGADLKG
ncbi:MAG: L-ribulose-5-phosphate 3-epimerase [Verrucomicrobiales bacterium]|jgi:L-ribulose-5-phosphate 3-epimerase